MKPSDPLGVSPVNDQHVPDACAVAVWVPLQAPGPVLTSLLEAVEACGASARLVKHVDTVAASKDCAVALVSGWTDGLSAPNPSDTVRALVGRGFDVVAVLDGESPASLAASCRLLLAGCSAVVDTRGPASGRDVTTRLLAAIAAARLRSAEHERLMQTMASCGIVGQSPAMLALFQGIVRFSALSDLSTLVTGETGTGKELVARALHRLDAKRCSHPFVAVNCGAISPAIAESELFGHRRGAFTHAHRDRRGLVRAADKGVLFLDEVAELDVAIQTKLLRVLQEGRVLAVGDEVEVPVDVRIIAATNRPLDRLVAEGRFRADLYHRLNVLPLAVPPLRDRRPDIPLLAAHFARRHQQLVGAADIGLHPAFLEAVSWLDLPGNARQLENLVRWALVHHRDGAVLELADLPSDVWADVAAREPGAVPLDGQPGRGTPVAAAWDAYPARVLAAHSWDLSRSLASCERSMIEAALLESRGNQSRAARLLGVTPRSVYNKLRLYRSA